MQGIRIRKVFLVSLAAALLPAWALRAQEDGYKEIVDDYAEIMLAMDQDSAMVDQVLEAVSTYLEDSGEDNLQKAMELSGSTREAFEELADSGETYVMEEEFAGLLEEYGIFPEEYEINAQMRYSEVIGYIQDMKTLEYYLEAEQGAYPMREELEFVWERQDAVQKLDREYYGCTVNYWFAEWEEDTLPYIQETLLDQFQSFTTENMSWETSRKAVEEKMGIYLDQVEKEMDKWTEYLGEQQEELYQMGN
ncbi:MAG TPA: hypothetical protein IAB84_10760 [Candidatus Choladousia intestinigallinarum]|nr:hypothetical protein [Candidatus Choladousia intestinigallinarum]